jgi:AcrR family transcriptional regulator
MKDVKEMHDIHSELRKRILIRAMEAFMRHGIREVKVDGIAADLGISKRTLYEIFEDKETLVLACLTQFFESRSRNFLHIARASNNVLEVILHIYLLKVADLRITNVNFYRDISKYPRVMAFLHERQHRNSEAVIAYFQHGVDEGLFRDDVNYGIVEMLLREQMNFLLTNEDHKNFSMLEVLDSIVLVDIRGICTDKGRAILEEFLRTRRK